MLMAQPKYSTGGSYTSTLPLLKLEYMVLLFAVKYKFIMLLLDTTINTVYKSCNTGTQTILNEVGASKIANLQKFY